MKLLALIIGAALYTVNAIRVEAPQRHLSLKRNQHQEADAAPTDAAPTDDGFDEFDAFVTEAKARIDALKAENNDED